MNDREIMQQALKTLLWANAEIDAWMFDGRGYGPEERPEIIKAVTALQERLAQPEQEPVAIPDDVLKIAKAMQKDGYHGPLSWAQLESLVRLVSTATSPPPQRKPLTDEWIHRTTVLLGFNPEWTTEIGIAHAIVRAAEAAHGIKEST